MSMAPGSTKNLCGALKEILQKAWKPIFMVIFVFFITFVVFPGVLFDQHFRILSTLGPDTQFSWYTLSLILTFNCLDTTGRWLGGFIMSKGLNFNKTKIATYTAGLLRMIFVAIAILDAIYDRYDYAFSSDAIKISNLCLFSLTNGLVSTLASIIAIISVPDNRKEQAGIFVGLAISVGIVIGSAVAIPIGGFLPKNWVNTE